MGEPQTLQLALRFATALALGVLVGLERERAKPSVGGVAGVRTFGLISLTGGVAAFVGDALDEPWLALAVFAAVAALVSVSHAVSAWRGDTGTTTEVSALLAFLLGFLCVRDEIPLAAGLAVASAAVLALKEWLHRLAQRIESADVEATLKFALVTLVVLPLVPDRSFGPAPFDVLNAHKVWLMVVLISAVNFASYLLVKIVGPEHGIGLSGLLGGLVSSTAVTLGFAQRSRVQPARSRPLALGILVAWTVMFLRILVLIAFVDRTLAAALARPMLAMAAPGLALCALLYRGAATERTSVPAGENPFELGQAIRFGLLFGVVIVVARAAQLWFGDAGLYLAGALAGLTDVDAIALSMADLARGEPAATAAAARTVVVAAVANTLVKGVLAAAFGSAALRRTLLAALAATLVAGGIGVLWL